MEYFILWFDTETTGLYPKIHDIIQLAGMIEKVKDPFTSEGREIIHEFNMNIQPINWDKIEQKAIDTHGISIEQMRKFSPPGFCYKYFKELFKKYIDPFKKNKELYDRLIPAGYNVGFDVGMLNHFFRKNKDNYLFSNISGNQIDVLPLVRHFLHLGIINTKDARLETVADHFNIHIEAHDAMSDIKATRLVYLELIKSINKIKREE